MPAIQFLVFGADHPKSPQATALKSKQGLWEGQLSQEPQPINTNSLICHAYANTVEITNAVS